MINAQSLPFDETDLSWKHEDLGLKLLLFCGRLRAILASHDRGWGLSDVQIQ
jgi:hypothetical protein